MKFINLSLLLLTLYCFPGESKALTPNKVFIPLTTSDGLPGRLVRTIIKNEQGYIWFGTIKGLAKFDGITIQTVEDNSGLLTGIDVTTLKSDAKLIWIGTKQGEILKYDIESNQATLIYEDANKQPIISIVSTNETLYFSTKEQNYEMNLLAFNKARTLFQTQGFFFKFKQTLYFANRNSIFRLSHNKIWQPYISLEETTKLITISAPHGDTLWLSFKNKAIEVNLANKKQQVLNLNYSPEAIAHNESTLFLSNFPNALVEIDLQSKKSSSHIYQPNSSTALTDNAVLSLSVLDENLWVGTFSKGINRLYLPASKLPSFSASSTENCLESSIINGFYETLSNQLLIATQNGAYLMHNESGSCNKINVTNDENNNYLAYSALEFHDNLYLGSKSGLGVIKDKHVQFLESFRNINESIYFIEPINNHKLLLGTYNSLFIFNSLNKDLVKLNSQRESFHESMSLKDKVIILSTSKVYSFEKSTLSLKPLYMASGNLKLNSISNSDSYIWLGTNSSKIIKLNLNGEVVEEFNIPSKNIEAFAIEFDSIGNPWISTNKGLYKLDIATQYFKQYTPSDGIQSLDFVRNSSFKSKDGKLYFGGRNGFNAFYPNDVKDNLVPPKVALTKLTRFNKEVIPGEDYEGFGIEKPIEYLDELEIGHRDYVIGFEFAGLHYADPMRNQYQFMLEGFHEDWVSTDAKNRNATFTNLAPGDYVLRVKAANKDGVWSLDEDNVALKIKVHPAPWLSWWAFLIYGLVILGSILWFIRYRTQSAIARANELEEEVSVRTKEIETQKNVIESLLERKNELFANISHEFRTPLTLILGPVEKELKTLDSPKNPKHLQMILRNATRLLGMVEQILKLTELKKEDTVNKVPHAVNPALEAIVDSFGSFAESKQIELSLNLDKDVNVMAANDALEVMVGNLVSNAIKYTPEGGKVTLESKQLEDTIEIIVTDTGVGMTKAQQDDVFERFVRLDKTSDIAGTGIGLSIVKELILAHDGHISVDSTEGQGSTFTISLPTTEQAALSDTHSTKAIEHLTQGETTTSETTQATEEQLTDAQQELILIIDDNPDMRDYIQEVLAPNYHCITADRGEAGIELAKAQVPDLIVCDIMMPGIDGYEVAKRLRGDIITSHIPLVLLTAKGDKESRIQGWNENIDDYMTKPFDQEELKARVSNIRAIRKLISLDSSSFSKADKLAIPTKQLNIQDRKFLRCLFEYIEENYQQQNMNRKSIAEAIAMSERQLHRKVKALFSKSVTELVREYRLKQAYILVKKGYALGQIAHECGFSSHSHFSRCFKAKYNKAPSEFNKA